MGVDILTALREGDDRALSDWMGGRVSSFETAFAKGREEWGEIGISLEAFSWACVKTAATRSKTESAFESLLEKILGLPDSYAAIGVRERLDPAFVAVGEVLGELLQDRFENSLKEYPRVKFSREEFERAVLGAAAEIALRRRVSLEEAVARRISFPDYFLAAAVLSQDSLVAKRAADTFSEIYYPIGQRYARTRWATAPGSEDKVNTLFFCALFPHTLSEKTGNPGKEDDERPPLLSEYRGQGPLGAWLTLTLGNMIRDGLRTTKSAVSLDEEQEVGGEGSTLPKVLVSVEEGQREDIDRSRCVEMLRSGLASAWEVLKPRERLTLTLQTLMEVPPSQIARKVFHVHEGTITKYTTNALRKIKEALESHGREKAGMMDGEIEGCFEFMRDAFPETDTVVGGVVLAAGEREKDR